MNPPAYHRANLLVFALSAVAAWGATTAVTEVIKPMAGGPVAGPESGGYGGDVGGGEPPPPLPAPPAAAMTATCACGAGPELPETFLLAVALAGGLLVRHRRNDEVAW